MVIGMIEFDFDKGRLIEIPAGLVKRKFDFRFAHCFDSFRWVLGFLDIGNRVDFADHVVEFIAFEKLPERLFIETLAFERSNIFF